MAKPGQPASGEFVDVPEMEWLVCEITEAPIEDGEYNGKPRRQVKVVFNVIAPGEDYDGATVMYWAGFSLHEKSKLTPLAEAITGKKAADLFDSFDTDDMVGKRVELIGKTHTYKKAGETEERSILKPTMFRPVGGKKSSAAERRAAMVAGETAEAIAAIDAELAAGKSAAKASDDIDI